MGLMSDDGNAASVPPMLAQLLDLPSATGVMSVEHQNGSVRVERELEGGALEVVDLPRPCVLAVQTGINQVRYASLKGIMAAKKKPIDVKTAADLGARRRRSARARRRRRSRRSSCRRRARARRSCPAPPTRSSSKLVGKIKELGLL